MKKDLLGQRSPRKYSIHEYRQYEDATHKIARALDLLQRCLEDYVHDVTYVDGADILEDIIELTHVYDNFQYLLLQMIGKSQRRCMDAFGRGEK